MVEKWDPVLGPGDSETGFHASTMSQVVASKFGLLFPTTKVFSLILSFLAAYLKNIRLKVSLICKSSNSFSMIISFLAI